MQIFIDGAGHEVRDTTAAPLAAAAAGTAAVGTVVPIVAGAGVGSTTAIPAGQTCTDRRGAFDLVAAGAPAAGQVATVKFAKEYASVPVVIVEGVNNTDGTNALSFDSVAVTTAGFNVVASGAATSGKTYRINYYVIP